MLSLLGVGWFSMNIRVLIRSGLKTLICEPDVLLDMAHNSTISDAAKELGRIYGEQVSRYLFNRNDTLQVICIKNHRKCLPGEVLEEEDEITFLPPIAGG